MALKKSLDFSNVSDSFEVIPAGTYKVHVFELTEKQSSNGNDMFKVVLKVSEGEYKGRQIFTNLTFVETAMFKIREFLIACGAKVEKKALNIDFSKCVGKQIKVIVYHRKNKDTDEVFADVKKFLSLDADASKGASGNGVKQDAGAKQDADIPFIGNNDDDDDGIPFK